METSVPSWGQAPVSLAAQLGLRWHHTNWGSASATSLLAKALTPPLHPRWPLPRFCLVTLDWLHVCTCFLLYWAHVKEAPWVSRPSHSLGIPPLTNGLWSLFHECSTCFQPSQPLSTTCSASVYLRCTCDLSSASTCIHSCPLSVLLKRKWFLSLVLWSRFYMIESSSCWHRV